MATYLGQPGVQTLTGTSGNDHFIFNFDQLDSAGLPSPEHDIDAGDIVNGGAGYDALWAGQTMDEGYSEDFDFRPVTFTSIEELDFNWMKMPMPGELKFNSSQFGAGLSNNLVVKGAWDDCDITVYLNTANFDASGWTFPTPSTTTVGGIPAGGAFYGWGPYIYQGSGIYNNQQVGTGVNGDTIHLVGSSAANKIVGTIVDDIITGAGGNDILRGGAGKDTINGGTGVDTADWSDATGAIVFTLSATGGGKTANVAGIGGDTLIGIENLTGGRGSDRLTGNNLANTFVGNAGNDTFTGRGGSDTYYVRDAGDKVIEAAGGGTADIVKTTLKTYTLAAEVEQLTFVGSGNFTGNGNKLGNRITGGVGMDTLNGAAGNDVLNGGAAADSLAGGLGADTLTGGSGADKFIYKEALFGADRVTDFRDGQDRLSFDDVVANSFSDFTIGNNGGTSVTVTLAGQTITLNSAVGGITLTAADFTFF